MEAILQAKEISKTYHTGSVDVPALKQCSLEFGKGEFTAIIGKSGSGKSTLLRILGSMDTPDTGSILIKGEDITHMKDKKLSGFRRRNIGFIYQDYSLFPEFTSYENIVMPILLDGKKPDDAKVDEILSELEISHCKNNIHQKCQVENSREWQLPEHLLQVRRLYLLMNLQEILMREVQKQLQRCYQKQVRNTSRQ